MLSPPVGQQHLLGHVHSEAFALLPGGPPVPQTAALRNRIYPQQPRLLRQHPIGVASLVHGRCMLRSAGVCSPLPEWRSLLREHPTVATLLQYGRISLHGEGL